MLVELCASPNLNLHSVRRDTQVRKKSSCCKQLYTSDNIGQDLITYLTSNLNQKTVQKCTLCILNASIINPGFIGL